MLKAVLIAVAAFLLFDAVAWGGAIRMEIMRETAVALAEIQSLDWRFPHRSPSLRRVETPISTARSWTCPAARAG